MHHILKPLLRCDPRQDATGISWHLMVLHVASHGISHRLTHCSAQCQLSRGPPPQPPVAAASVRRCSPRSWANSSPVRTHTHDIRVLYGSIMFYQGYMHDVLHEKQISSFCLRLSWILNDFGRWSNYSKVLQASFMAGMTTATSKSAMATTLRRSSQLACAETTNRFPQLLPTSYWKPF